MCFLEQDYNSPLTHKPKKHAIYFYITHYFLTIKETDPFCWLPTRKLPIVELGAYATFDNKIFENIFRENKFLNYRP